MNRPPLVVSLCRRLPTRWNTLTLFAGALVIAWPLSAPAQPQPQRLNNLTALLLEAAPTRAGETFSFTRPREGKGLAGPGWRGLQEQRGEVIESLGLRLGRSGKRPGDHQRTSEEGEGVPTRGQTAAEGDNKRRPIHKGRLRAGG